MVDVFLNGFRWDSFALEFIYMAEYIVNILSLFIIFILLPILKNIRPVNSMFPETLKLFNKHCPSCNCQSSEAFYQWKNQRVPMIRKAERNPLVAKPILPIETSSLQVGEDVIPNKIVWFKSVSPRPARITIKVSSPDRPNLKPSQVSTSLHKRISSSSTPQIEPLYFSRIANPEQSMDFTPIKNIESERTLDSSNLNTTVKQLGLSTSKLISYN